MIYFENTGIHIFDCDGVILDSNFLKIKAMEQTLHLIGVPTGIASSCIDMFRGNFGRTRAKHFAKFSEIFSQHGRSDLSPNLVDAEATYSSKVQNLYPRSKIIDETVRYIDTINLTKKMYVVSASNELELRHILPQRLQYFSEENILGGPITKVDNILNILKLNNSSTAILYGDSTHDAMAALATGIDFVGLKKYSADPAGLSEFCSKHELCCIHVLHSSENKSDVS